MQNKTKVFSISADKVIVPQKEGVSMTMKKIKKTKIPAAIFDIDDTVVDFTGLLCYLFNAKNHSSITESDLICWNFLDAQVEDSSGRIVTGAELREFFQEYEASGLYAAIPAIKESVLALELIRKMGYKIILLTARPEKFFKDTEINFILNKIPYDEIIFDGNKPKQINKLARKHSIAIFADDKYEYVKSVYETDKVDMCVLINRAHNKSVSAEEIGDIIRANDLLEVVRHLPMIS